MPCQNLTEILKGCENNIGGIKNFYITAWDNVSATTTNASGVITGITMTTGTTFVEYEFNKNSASYVEEATISLENGSTFYTTTTTLMIPYRENAKRTSLALLAAGQQNLAIIVEDGNGIFWFQGLENGANLTAQGEGSGAAKGDGSKYSLTFVSEEPEMMPTVTSAAVAAVI